ncbi:MAG: esterase-like activity of phytase family protein [Alphaproteobacteria bacterium]
MRWASFFGAALLIVLPAAAKPSLISASPVTFHQTDLSKTRQGPLRFVAGFELTASADWFGGLSGMAMNEHGTMMRLVSDKAHWLDVLLAPDKQGVPTSFQIRDHGALNVGGGVPLLSRLTDYDAEEVIDLSPKNDLTGPTLVSFERNDRLLAYTAPDASPVVKFKPSQSLVMNKGIEALARLRDGRILMLAEGTTDDAGLGLGWIADADFKRVDGLTYRRSGDFEPTAAAQLPDGDVLLLERSYSPLAGVAMQLRRVPLSEIERGHLEGTIMVRLGGGYTIDNFEAMALHQRVDGTVLLYLISDDNFNPAQRTLFMVYALDR